MDHERVVWGCAEGIKKHHGIAERKLSITGHIVITDIDDIVLKVFRRDQYAVRVIPGIRKSKAESILRSIKDPEIGCLVIQALTDLTGNNVLKRGHYPELESEQRFHIAAFSKRSIGLQLLLR